MDHTNHLPTRYELVTEGRFEDQQSAKSSMRGDLSDLKANHDEDEIPVKDTDVLLLLLHFLGDKDGIKVWMIHGTKQ